MHGHDHEHTHDYEHTHDHDIGHDHRETGGHHSHDSLLGSKKEAAAFLRYTLNHNAHHEQELSGLAHSLRHLQLSEEAEEIEGCIAELNKVNVRLEAVLDALK
jgi:hypothetical protein